MEGKRTFWVAIAAIAAVTIMAVGGMAFKVITDGAQLTGFAEWAIPMILGLFGIRTGIEKFTKKSDA